jgi:4-hydroxy-tetrahydrodipicolinate reductase
MSKIKIAIAGSSGRMGRILLESVAQADDLVLHAALEHAGSALVGRDAGELFGASCGIKISADVESALRGADVLIDFTRPEGTLHHLEICRKLGVSMARQVSTRNKKPCWARRRKMSASCSHPT